MSIRLDPRRLAALKLLAAEAGVRPGELVTQWVEERLDAARAGGATVGPAAAPAADALADLNARIEELSRRVDALAQPGETAAPAPLADQEAPPAGESAAAEVAEAPPARRRGRPPKSGTGPGRPTAGAPRIPLHEEIAAVIRERGPQTAGELAAAIAERGRYAPPRSAKPLDAATVSARVSNPVYRSRFVRSEGRIGLASTNE